MNKHPAGKAITAQQSLETFKKELAYLKSRLDRSNIKMSKVAES